MLNLKKTDSKIVQQNPPNPSNNSSLQQFAPEGKVHSDHINEVLNFQEENNQNLTQVKQQVIKEKTSQNQQKHSDTYTQNQKRSKMPLSLKNTLRRRAIQSGNFQQKKDIEKVSPITLKILSKFKRQQLTCEICLGVMKQEDTVHLCKCEHMHCKNCVRDYVTFKIKMFEEVICPKEQCDKVMDEQTGFYRNLPEQLRKQYLKIHNFYMTSKDPSLKMCPKEDCEGIIKLVDNEPVVCKACRRQFCAKCFLDKHQGDCDQQEIDFLQNNLHFRQCENCKFIVERTEGCNHMTCRCKYEFCYVCGKKWTGYDHACNQNRMDQQNDGLFEQNGCCGCLNCCQQTCGDTWAYFFQFPMRLFLTILFVGVVLIVVSQALLMIVFYLFAAIVAGILGYSIEFLCQLCQKDKIALALLCTVLFPIAICVGLYKAFTEMFLDLAADQLREIWNITYDGFTYFWI